MLDGMRPSSQREKKAKTQKKEKWQTGKNLESSDWDNTEIEHVVR